MPLVVALARTLLLQRGARVDVHPYRASDLLPLVDWIVITSVRHAVKLLAWRPHRDQIIRYSHTAHCGIFTNRFMQQSERFRSLHLRDRIFPNDRLGMEYEPLILKRADQVSSKILQANESIALFTGREQHAVKRDIPTRPHDPLQFRDEEREVLEEFLVCTAVA